MTRQQACRVCGKPLEAQVTWVTDDVLQVLWCCEKCKSGWVRDVYFTGTGAPSPFADANLSLADMVEPLLEGCPTDEEIQLMQDEDNQEEEEYEALLEFVGGWAEGRGYGDFPDAPVDGAVEGVDYEVPYEFL